MKIRIPDDMYEKMLMLDSLITEAIRVRNELTDLLETIELTRALNKERK